MSIFKPIKYTVLKMSWKKLLVILTALLLGFGLGQLVDLDNKNVSFAQKEKCKKYGDNVYENYVKRYGMDNMLEPEYAYNQTLNTCLVYIDYSTLEGNIQVEVVRDSITNKELVKYVWLSGMSEEQKEAKKREKEIFEKNKRRLFSE